MEICSVFLTKNFQLQFVLEVTANLFSKDKGKMVLTHAAVSIFFSQFIKFQTLSGFFSISNRGGTTPPLAETQGRECAPCQLRPCLHVLRCTILSPLTIHVLVSALGDLLKMY